MINKLTEVEVINRLSKRWPNYDFTKFKYINDKTKSTIICKEHGEFLISHNRLMSKNRISPCKLCSNKINSQKNLLKEEAVIDNLKSKFEHLDFSKFVYINSLNKSIVICNNHGEFESSYHRLMSKDNKYGCSECAKELRKVKKCKSSSYEKEIVNYIKSNFHNIKIIENDRTTIKNIHTNNFLELDILLPDINLAIEFNGKYYHSDKFINRRKGFISFLELHNYKTNKCKEKNIKLIHINEIDYIKNKNKILESIKSEIIDILY